MTNWKNVLVYADGRPESALAIAEALRLAEHSAGEVTAFDVLHYLPARIPPGLLAMEQAELLSLMQEQRLEQLLEETDRFRRGGRVEVQVVHGNPAFELIRRAVRGKHDLIVKTARGREVKHVTSFGSTALHLVRKSPAPVLLVSPNRALLEAPKILCALELDDTDARHELNRRLLASSRQLAAVYGAEIHVVHVIDQERTRTYRAFLARDLFERFAKDRQLLLQKDMEHLIKSELDGVPGVHAHLVEGDPSDYLVEMVQAERVSHLLMGSIAHLTPGHLMGSLTEDVLSRVECSVFTLKPANFKSPVEVDVSSAA